MSTDIPLTPEAKLLQRILSRCVSGVTSWNGTPCWVWQGCCCNKGYAQIAIREDGKKNSVCRRVHRVLWELVNEKAIRAGYTLDHRCLNTRCIRPDHLEEVTRSVNTARGNTTRTKKREIRW